MFTIKLTQVGGMQEWRGTERYYGGALLPGMEAVSRQQARRYETQAEAEQAAEQIRRAPWMKAQQVEVVEEV